MKREPRITGYFGDRFGCFGNFEIEDEVCKTRCAIRLRCCIEKEKNTRMEMLDEWVSFEDLTIRNH